MARFVPKLSSRGVGLLCSGLLIGIAASYFGIPKLAAVGWFLVAVPFVSLLVVVVTLPRLSLKRSVVPPLVPLGESARIKLLLSNLLPNSFSALRITDLLPDQLGSEVSFECHRGLGRWQQAATYELTGSQRGSFLIGPLWVAASDPLGLAVVSWRLQEETSLRVKPRIWQLQDGASLAGEGALSEATPQRIGQASPDDLLVRDHQIGDDLRRVHWKLSAKRDKLMVRLEENPWDPAISLLIDSRSCSQLGSGPTSSLEWRISWAASLVQLFDSRSQRIHLISADGLLRGRERSSYDQQQLMNTLIDLVPSPRENLIKALDDTSWSSESRVLFAGLGLLQPADATVLVAAGNRVHQRWALAPAAAAWSCSPQATAAHQEACRLLRNAGWRLTEYRPTDSVPQTWLSLLEGRSL